ncbi:nonsense-mediated mRNA decay factor SMG7-like [Coffea arabica]|uniref:Protein SMG7L-like n=1 Tax=Coffea arabica TaxID=13443 RepID=A0A6P6W987_COFAR|nr:protein SMG7L-like [Coffea arabica]XP_027111810.1 protein SMG7L-like [Coffea arabica]
MEHEATAMHKDQWQKQDNFLEVLNIEKQLLALIHSKGLLHKDVQELYRKVRTAYQSIILNDYDVVDLQEVEYFLWKLHYKHIVEFRKSMRQHWMSGESTKGETSPVDIDSQGNINRYVDGFKTFLSEATDFYSNLTKAFREVCGLPGEVFLYNKGDSSFSTEQMKLSKCQFACHRFLICLGDLARYGELCKKQDASKWSVAFTYYLEASRIWPASGNPHNQLALLATYVGDAFLALYHCTRSLAVKEPFPDAWNNLMLLFEENGSSHLSSLSSETHIDLLKPFEKVSLQAAPQSLTGSSNKSNLETNIIFSTAKTELWPLFVRLISFFLGRSSLEEFESTLSSTVEHLESLVLLDDEQLKAALESYKLMDSSRKGPYRALQLVSIFIFILHNLTESPQNEKLNENDKQQKSGLTQLALIATYICIARLLERCLKCNQLEKCPLLPAVLVFVEWLVGTLDEVEKYAADDKVMSAMSYFFSALADLLNRFNIGEGETACDKSALWEDHELRGFEPMANAHASLDFTSTHWEWMETLDSKRSHRIFHAGMRIVNRSANNKQWIFCDKKGLKFFTFGSMELLGQGKTVGVSNLNVKVKEVDEQISRNVEVHEQDSLGETQPQRCQKSVPVSTEEEEVILFNPITRHNSAPLYKYITENDHMYREGLKEPALSADECLRRATSMFIGKNQPRSDRASFSPDATNVKYNKPLKESATYPAGPPSLSAWVFDRDKLDYEPEKGIKNFTKHELMPIQETAFESLTGLLHDRTRDSVAGSAHVSAAVQTLSPPTYVAPVPSAPLLPDDATWSRGNLPSFPEYKSALGSRETDGILGAPPVSGYSNGSAPHGPLDFSPVLPGLVHGYPPLLGMSSSEWLYHYRNNHKLDQTSTLFWPVHMNGPGPLSSFQTNDLSRFDLFSQWGNPLASTPTFYMESPQLHPGSSFVYSAGDPQKDSLLSYQRASPFVCGAVTDPRPEQQPLLHYLKEKEWQLHSPQFRGSAFMGN